jgi:hypothetical protein
VIAKAGNIVLHRGSALRLNEFRSQRLKLAVFLLLAS